MPRWPGRDSDRLAVLQAGVELVLEEVRAAVEDWVPMRRARSSWPTSWRAGGRGTHEPDEARAFLRWLSQDHFTFLGYREYELSTGQGRPSCGDPRHRAGHPPRAAARPRKALKGRAVDLAIAHPLVLTKANSRATVHRPAYLDYVGVKRFAPTAR